VASAAPQEKGHFVYVHGAGNGRDAAEIAARDDRCRDDDLASCHALGLALMTPRDKESDNNRRAFAAFEKGCLGGYAPSCNGLGVMYARGMGVPSDGARAVALYKQACEGEVSTACLHAAMAYESGREVAADWATAVAFYERACDLGEVQGCQTAGKAFAEGDRVPRDLAKARKLYDRGCQEGGDEACKEREKLGSGHP
jgi:hypothetical protein